MDIWAHITQFLSWPPGWDTVFAVLAGVTAANARLTFRDFVVLFALAALLYFPLVWFGPALGLLTLSRGAVTFHLASWQPQLQQGTVQVGSFILATLAMIAWKKIVTPQPETDSPEAKHAGQMRVAHWISLGGLAQAVLMITTPFFHLLTVLMVPASVEGLVATFLLPGFAQAWWMVALWPKTASLSHPLTFMCLLWLGAFATFMLARWKSGGRRGAEAVGLVPVSPKRAPWPSRRPTATGC
jgi:hypothetical protein